MAVFNCSGERSTPVRRTPGCSTKILSCAPTPQPSPDLLAGWQLQPACSIGRPVDQPDSAVDSARLADTCEGRVARSPASLPHRLREGWSHRQVTFIPELSASVLTVKAKIGIRVCPFRSKKSTSPPKSNFRTSTNFHSAEEFIQVVAHVAMQPRSNCTPIPLP